MSEGDLGFRVRSGRDGSVELVGGPAEIAGVADILRRHQETRIRLAHPAESPEPYAEWLSALSIRIEAEPKLSVFVEDGGLVIAGDRQALQILADNLTSFAENPGGMGGHLHIEYFPEHFYLRPGSAPVIVVTPAD